MHFKNYVPNLFIYFEYVGNEQMLVTAQCEKVLHGGGCKPDECSKGCQAMYGAAAMGLCFFFQKPNDTCLCRYHC